MNNTYLKYLGGFIAVFAVIVFGVYAVFIHASTEKHGLEARQEERIQSSADISYTTISVNGHALRVEIAATPEETTHGLSGHAPLGADEGMLFLFDGAAPRPFWMKDMLFDLDMLWIRDGNVVEIAKNMPAPSGVAIPATYRPSEPADMVLEINAGRSDELGIETGTKIEGIPIY